MNARNILTVLFAVALFAGCTRTPKNETPNQPIGTSEWLSSYRTTVENASPGSVVGVVNAVVSSANLASVGDVPAGSLKNNMTITFVDGSGNPVVVGTVVSVNEYGNVHVKYENPIDGRRAPEVGDAAVWLKK